MWRRSVIGIGALLLVGCATPYQDRGFTGGVRVSRVDDRTLAIQAVGNSFTDQMTVADHALLRAAQSTLQAGYGHFQIVNAADRSYTLAYPIGRSYTFLPKPGVAIYVRMYPGRKPVDAPEGVHDAQDVVTFLGPKYGVKG